MPSPLTLAVLLFKLMALGVVVATFWPAISVGVLAPVLNAVTSLRGETYSPFIGFIDIPMFLFGAGGVAGLLGLAFAEVASLRGVRPSGRTRLTFMIGIAWGTLAASGVLALSWFPTGGSTRAVALEDVALFSCVLMAIQALWRLR